jgi:hypothetical protein
VDHPGLRFECRPDKAPDLAFIFDEQRHRKGIIHRADSDTRLPRGFPEPYSKSAAGADRQG